MTHPVRRSFVARTSTRVGLLVLAIPALALHLVYGLAYAVRAWAEKLADAWRDA